MQLAQRRQNLGPFASAALPALWKAIARKGWSHTDFAERCGISTAHAARILYGDRGGGRKVVTFCVSLGVRLVLWGKACPPNWRPHTYDALRPKKPKTIGRRSSSAPEALPSLTGTDS